MKISEAKETGEERIMAKSRPTLNLESKTESSSASNCPGVFKAPSPSLSLAACAFRPAAEDSNQNDAASSSQVWQSDVELNASAGKPAAEVSGIVDVDSARPNHFQMSVPHVPHLERAYSNLRQKIGRKSGDDMNNLDTNSLMWRMFMSATLDAAVHLGKLFFGELKFDQKIRHNERKDTCSTCHKSWPQIKQRFKVYQRLIGTHTPGKRQLSWPTKQSSYWQQKSLNSPIQCCLLAKMNPHPEFIDAWKKKIEWFYRYSFNIENWIKWRGPLEFEWKKFPPRYRKWWTKCSVNLSNSQVESSSCQCTMTLYGSFFFQKQRNLCIANSMTVAGYAKRFSDSGRFSGLDQKRNGAGRTRTSRKENGRMSLNTCCSTLAKADLPCSVEQVLWNEELWKAKEVGNLSFHFCGDQSNCWREFLHYYLRQSAQCFRSSSGFVWRTGLADF